MRQGVDYSRNPADWDAFCDALLARGRDFVGRYLPWDLVYAPRDKRVLTTRECEAMARHGIEIFAWWENSPSHVGYKTERRALDGYNAGAEDARRAGDMMTHFGQPERPVYFCVDTDAHYTQVTPYFEGVLSVLPLSQVGVYGGYSVVHGLCKARLAQYACQTQAWMYGRGWSPYAQLRQWTVSKPGYPGYIEGVQCDGLDAMVDDFGQWTYGETYEEDDDMYSDTDRTRDAYTAKRVLATSFDVKILEAKHQGDAAEVLYLEKLKARDVRNEEIRLGLRSGKIDETPVER